MSRDPYKYFRIEARELVERLGGNVLALEKGGDPSPLVAGLLRHAHTLKGAARVVRQRTIADHAHAIEELLAGRRDGAAITAEMVAQLFRTVDAISAALQKLEPSPAAVTTTTNAPSPSPADESWQSVRVEVAELDALLEGIAEVAVRLGALRRAAPAGVAAGLDEVEREVAQVREAASRLRLIPVATLFPGLERTLRDAALVVGKQAALHAHGGEVRIDGHVLSHLRDALHHIVRNAVVHGIEAPGVRTARGKPPVGRVDLVVERRGNRVALVCRDDGAGIDAEAVRAAAIERGLVDTARAVALPPEEVLRLVLQPGLTTAPSVTQVAGRGVGLDVVRETLARLKGEIVVRSAGGTTFELIVPISMSSLRVLEIEAAGRVMALPLDAVRRTLRIAEHEIARSAERDSVVCDGEVLPFVALARALDAGAIAPAGRRHWSALIVETAGSAAALGVDRLLGTATITMRPLSPRLGARPTIAGASLDADGHPQLVLDPRGLLAAALATRPAPAAPVAARRLPILVVDDSLTTRMLEQSILESAGFEVELAVSGEDALVKAHERAYALFLVDVEMPGMDGFALVTQLQNDPRLRHIPAVMVTSRNGPEDVRRGAAAGARAHIVKGEFDQGQLLRLIRELTEAPR